MHKKQKRKEHVPPERWFPEASFGLSFEQVRLREEGGYLNKQPKSITRTTGQILRENLLTFLNALNISIFIALLMVHSYNNLFFMGVVCSNILIGIVQELRSKRTLEALSLINESRCRVVRDGKTIEIGSAQIVLDDIICLSMGQQIPTDCILLSGAIETDESHLTGESRNQFKTAGDLLFSGSAVLSGTCRARVDRIGMDCYANALANEAKRYKRPKSQLMQSLKLVIRFTGSIVLPIGALLFSRAYIWMDHTLTSSVEQTAASMLGMIPSGLMLLASISLSIGVLVLGRRNTLVQQPHCIETLSRVDMLCLDKTGTLTTGRLFVARMLCTDALDEGEALALLGDIVHTMPDVNPTSHALHAFSHMAATRTATGIAAFSSERRYSAAAFEDCTLYIGAPELLCPQLLCADRPDRLQHEMHEALVKGYRVLAFSCAPAPNPSGQILPPDGQSLQLLSLLLLRDEIRAEAAETIRFFTEQDVSIRLISGDNPATAAHIARRLEVPLAERYIDVSPLNEEGLLEAANYYTVFGRVSPQQKKQLIAAFKRQGHTVAMTGDGVNDLLALREADCSIALYNGSDAARQISQLVLLTNDFSALPAAVMEGRRVINNITRTASLFLVKTMYSFLLTAGSVLIGLTYPFQPIQLTLISSMTVGIPSFFLSMEPNRTRIQGDFLKNVLERAVPGGVCVFLYTLAAGLFGRHVGLTQDQVNTICVYLAGTAGLCVLLRVCMPMHRYRFALFITMAVLFFCSSWVLIEPLRLFLPPSMAMVLMYAMMASICYPLLAGLAWLLRRMIR